MEKVSHLRPMAHAPTALRRIAAQIEAGELEDEVTLVCGNAVFHAGGNCDYLAAQKAVWNLNFGLAFLMKLAIEAADD